VSYFETLRRSVRPNVETIVLDADRDGLAQVTEALAGRSFATVHVVAHGEPGQLFIGSTALTAAAAHGRAAELERWFGERAPFEVQPEILLYGCDAAQG